MFHSRKNNLIFSSAGADLLERLRQSLRESKCLKTSRTRKDFHIFTEFDDNQGTTARRRPHPVERGGFLTDPVVMGLCSSRSYQRWKSQSCSLCRARSINTRKTSHIHKLSQNVSCRTFHRHNWTETGQWGRSLVSRNHDTSSLTDGWRQKHLRK